ncbi:MAG: nucleoside-diphosphate-sugar epimerase [Myxococcota bacterium]|jgi:nucleoside-diphosphate-sugar epimerase
MNITILGATGGIGDAVTTAFIDAGHTVTVLVRDPAKFRHQPTVRILTGDAHNAVDLDNALHEADCVFHGINVPYPQWDPEMLDLTQGIVDAAVRAQVTVLLPGNVYNFGPDFAQPLTESSPKQPVSRKGALRNRLEAILRAGSDGGAPVIVARAGDFFGVIGTSTWMHHLASGAVTGGKIQYPAPLNIPHSWAFGPDIAQVFRQLAERRHELPTWSEFNVTGHVLTGEVWTRAVADVLGDPTRGVRRMPWWAMQPLRLVSPMVRELWEMRYLWDQPVRMSEVKLAAFLGKVPHTPLHEALTADLLPADTSVRRAS